jgi:transcriptional regulator with XRE-family HTH domain
VTHPAYLVEKAVRLRTERGLTIDEIAERLALPRTTIYGWVRHLGPLENRRQNPHPGVAGMQRKYRELREAAYAQGQQEFSELAADPTFRDFVCMYIGEGHKRCRNTVALANSDSRVVQLATHWIRRFARNPVTFWVQYHADQDERELCEFWGEALGITPTEVRLQRKSNSGQLRGRTWRCVHGVMTVRASDTLLRARLQAWMDCVQAAWLEFAAFGA